MGGIWEAAEAIDCWVLICDAAVPPMLATDICDCESCCDANWPSGDGQRISGSNGDAGNCGCCWNPICDGVWNPICDCGRNPICDAGAWNSICDGGWNPICDAGTCDACDMGITIWGCPCGAAMNCIGICPCEGAPNWIWDCGWNCPCGATMNCIGVGPCEGVPNCIGVWNCDWDIWCWETCHGGSGCDITWFGCDITWFIKALTDFVFAKVPAIIKMHKCLSVEAGVLAGLLRFEHVRGQLRSLAYV